MKKPNVLFILTDDQRYDTIHALGNKQIKTPNLDKLVEASTAFTHAHIPGGTSGAVCMPSRAMINSGKTLFHLYEQGDQIPKAHTTMGQCFRENGYNTIGIGKWHNGTESYARSFCDGDSIFFGGMWDHWNVPVCSYHEDGIYEKTANFTPDFTHVNHPMPMICDKLSVGVHSTELFTDTALSFIEKEKDSDKPFFMYLSYLAPHDPRTMPKEFKEMYRAEDIELPENFVEKHPFYFGVGEYRGETRDEDLAAYPRNELEIKQHIADYYAMISHIDYNVGRLIESLRQNGLLENTIVVFTGDNGLAVGQHGLMGKQSVYEHSVRVPLIIGGPGVKKGGLSNNYVYLLDIYPTLCELAGIEIPQSVEGKSFKPMLQGEDIKIREDLYFTYTHVIRGVKTDRYKLIEYRLSRESSQLFDLQNDPHEMVNLFNDSKYADVVKELRALMLKYKCEWEDTREDGLSKYTKEYWDYVQL